MPQSIQTGAFPLLIRLLFIVIVLKYEIMETVSSSHHQDSLEKRRNVVTQLIRDIAWSIDTNDAMKLIPRNLVDEKDHDIQIQAALEGFDYLYPDEAETLRTIIRMYDSIGYDDSEAVPKIFGDTTYYPEPTASNRRQTIKYPKQP